MKIFRFPYYMNIDPVHEHNHTRILVSEVLCSLGGQETQNVPMVTSSKIVLLNTFTCKLFSVNSFCF